MATVIYSLVGVGVAALIYHILIVKTVVHQYEAGLLYRNGRFRGRLDPGGHRIMRSPSQVRVMDLRKTTVTVPGQEVLSGDNVGLKVSAVVTYDLADPERAVHSVQNYSDELYVAVQLAVRSAISETNIEDVLNQRVDIGQRLLAGVTPQAEEIGLRVYSVEVKDVMFPGDLKKVFTEVVKAQKQGQAALEAARGETAALRTLANAARTLERNPSLLHLRTLHTLTELAERSGVTVVLGTPAPSLTAAPTNVAARPDPEPNKENSSPT
ncbi:MAG: slipin family protein [Planctomycetota bacterium]|jgi:regulator of protease activity HflC (stomatin/prohibitin superfamily)